jgi:hypothetical protein
MLDTVGDAHLVADAVECIVLECEGCSARVRVVVRGDRTCPKICIRRMVIALKRGYRTDPPAPFNSLKAGAI